MAITELIQINPRISIVILSLIASLIITIISYFLTDRGKMKEIRERQKEIRLELKQVKNDPEKVMELNKKMMQDFPEQMRASLKPMIVTIVPILIFFGWLKSTFAGTDIAGTWLWWYIISSIIFSILIRKIFGLQ